MSDTIDTPRDPASATSTLKSGADGAPDWATITEPVPCSRCGYELRMLTQPRCPECGLTFAWSDLLHASRTSNLFEHTWRQRPIRSWLGTLALTMRPRRFWTGVSLHDHIHPAPLVFLLLTSPLLYALTLAIISGGGLLTLTLLEPLYENRAEPWAVLLEIMAQSFRALWSIPYYDIEPYLWMVGSLAAQIFFAGVVLVGLRQTMARCRVRTVQMLRVVAYSAGAVMVQWVLTLFGMLVLISAVQTLLMIPVYGAETFVLMGAAGLVHAYHLHAALSKYLHLTRSAVVAVGAVLVAGLAVFTAAFTIVVSRYF